jgi:hypothetical protein
MLKNLCQHQYLQQLAKHVRIFSTIVINGLFLNFAVTFCCKEKNDNFKPERKAQKEMKEQTSKA